MKYTETPIGTFRFIAFWEGVSYLALLCIAMPLKYLLDYPVAVKAVGWIHGALFLAFIVSLLDVLAKKKLTFIEALISFIASLLPFGTFVLDSKLLKDKDF